MSYIATKGELSSLAQGVQRRAEQNTRKYFIFFETKQNVFFF